MGEAVGGRAEGRLPRLPGDQSDPWRQLGPPARLSRNGDHGAGRGRPDADHRRSIRRYQGGARRIPRVRGRSPRRGDCARGAHSGSPPRRRRRGAPDRGVVAILDDVFRDEWGRVLANLIGFLGDFELAEEAAQEAFAIAAERWPRDGTPGNPRAWLVATARNRAIDRIRRGRALVELMPDEPEVRGLLALMLLNDARREARFADGTIVLLRDQDRSLWDFDQIEEGRAELDRALALRGRGPYVLQAALAVLHTDEPQDWPQIAALYGELASLTGSAVVELKPAAPL